MTTYLDSSKVDIHHLLQCLHDITMGLSLLVCQESSEEEEVGLLANEVLYLPQEVQLPLAGPPLSDSGFFRPGLGHWSHPG